MTATDTGCNTSVKVNILLHSCM